MSQHLDKDQEASLEAESPVFSVEVIGEVEIETEEGSGHLIPVVLNKDQSTTDDSNQDNETLPPVNTNTVDKEYISAVDYINKLEEKVNYYAKQMMGLENQLSKGRFLPVLIKVYIFIKSEVHSLPNSLRMFVSP